MVFPSLIQGTSDPLVKIYRNEKKSMFKTKVIKKTLNPEWNQSFTVENVVRPDDISTAPLNLKFGVEDWNQVKSNKPLGIATVDVWKVLADGGGRADLWLDGLKVKDKVVEGKVRVVLEFEPKA